MKSSEVSVVQRLLQDFSPPVRRALRVDLSVMLLSTLFTSLTTPFIGLILRRELGATAFQLSILASANAACLLLSLAVARVVDGRRPLPYVVWPSVVSRGLFLLTPFVITPWQFVGMLVSGTLLGTVSGPAQAAVIERVYPRQERGRALGFVRVVGALAAMGLALGAGQLVGRLGHRLVFAMAGMSGMLGSLRLRRLRVPAAAAAVRQVRPRLSEAWRVVRADHAYRRLLTASFVFGSGIWLMMPANPILLADVMHATTGQVGLLSAVAAGAALVGNLVWGRLADRRSSAGALQAVYLVGSLTPLIYWGACVWLASPWLLVGASVFESLMHTGLDLVWMLALMELGGEERTMQYAAIGATMAGLRGMLGPLVSGLLLETAGIEVVYLSAAGLMMGGAWLVTRHLQNTPRYIEQPAQTSGGFALVNAVRNAS
jgi:MFS family permease